MRTFCHQLLTLVATFIFVACAATPLQAGPYEDAIPHSIVCVVVVTAAG